MGWAGLEQPTRQREKSNAQTQTTRTTADENYRSAIETKSLPVKGYISSTFMPGRAPSSLSARASRTATSRYPMLPM
jgi:hypothetical protein